MNVPGFFKLTDDGNGYECSASDCDSKIALGEQAIVAEIAVIEDRDGRPYPSTKNNAGIYHERCFRSAGENQ